MRIRRQYRWLLAVLGLVLGFPFPARTADEPQELSPDVVQKLLSDPDSWKTYWESFAKQRGFPATYSAEAIEAWVIDEETRQPLEGVIVVANWKLKGGGVHPDVIGSLVIMETVTDANGRFAFPAWGPKPRPSGSYLHTDDPELLLFKSDYHYKGLENEFRKQVDQSSLRHSKWNARLIKLKKFTKSAEQYAEHLSHLDISLSFAIGGSASDCEWKQIPRMLVALHLEKIRFKEKGIRNNLSPINTMPNQARCGSAEQFLRSYMP